MAEYQSTIGSPGLVGIYETYKDELDRNPTQIDGYASSEQAGSWRRVPYVNLLPDSRRQLPVNLIMRTGLALVVGLLIFMTINGYLDWKAIEAVEIDRAQGEAPRKKLYRIKDMLSILDARDHVKKAPVKVGRKDN